MSITFGLKSVAGGWQSCINTGVAEVTFGPIFNKSNELWTWQRDSQDFSRVIAARTTDEALRLAAAIHQTYHL